MVHTHTKNHLYFLQSSCQCVYKTSEAAGAGGATGAAAAGEGGPLAVVAFAASGLGSDAFFLGSGAADGLSSDALFLAIAAALHVAPASTVFVGGPFFGGVTGARMGLWVSVFFCECVYVYVCMYVCMCVCECVCMRVKSW
jgi:hypothetical protein